MLHDSDGRITERNPEYKCYIFGSIFILFFLADFSSKIGDFYNLPLKHIATIVKSTFQVGLILHLIYRKNEGRKILKKLLILLLCFIIGHIFLDVQESIVERIILNIKILDWYFFLFFLAAFTSSDNSLNIANQKFLFKCFELVFVINTLAMLVGLVLDIDILKSYYGERYGLNGLIRNASHVSYICIIYIIYFYYKWRQRPTTLNSLFFITSYVCMFLVASKAVLLFGALFSLYFIIERRYYKVLALLTICLTIAVYQFEWIVENIVKDHFLVLYNVYCKDGLLTMLFSYRNESISEKMLPFIQDHWQFVNFLVGGAYFNIARTEFEFLDLLWFFGILGSIFYLALINKYVIKLKDFFNLKPLLALLVIITLAGSFFSSVPVVTYFFILILYLRKTDVINW